MNGFPLEIVLAIVGIAVPILAFVWEFVLVGRKRLGYRVQMDTPVTGEIESVFPGVLPQLRPEGDGAAPELQDLSVVLVRIENNGLVDVDSIDYAAPEGDVGMHIHFPHRRVIGMAVTELSDDAMGDNLKPGTGIGSREDAQHRVGIIDLPKVPMDRGDHYKILAILQRTAGAGEYPPPVVRGKLKGGRVSETRSQVGASPKLVALIGFLVAIIAVQFTVNLNDDTGSKDAADCASGKLTLVGSTAFDPAIRDAANAFAQQCSKAQFAFEFDSSDRGLTRLDEEGKDNPALLAITDGPKGVGYPTLLPRTLALSTFTMLVNPSVNLRNLTTEQIRDLYAGRVNNWQLLGGPDLPVRVVNRSLGSGTREAFRKRVLGDDQPPAPAATSCRTIAATNPPGPAFCEVPVTNDMLKTIADLPGSIGYSEYSDAARNSAVTKVTIDGHTPTRDQVLDRSYPFWSVEYAYSNGELPATTVGFAVSCTTDEAAVETCGFRGGSCPRLTVTCRCWVGRRLVSAGWAGGRGWPSSAGGRASSGLVWTCSPPARMYRTA